MSSGEGAFLDLSPVMAVGGGVASAKGISHRSGWRASCIDDATAFTTVTATACSSRFECSPWCGSVSSSVIWSSWSAIAFAGLCT